jgi:hypothetical protein
VAEHLGTWRNALGSNRTAEVRSSILLGSTKLQALPKSRHASLRVFAAVASRDRRIVMRRAVPDAEGISCESFFTTNDAGHEHGSPIRRPIMEAHGGRITADNAGAGGGARFPFTLPAASYRLSPTRANRHFRDSNHSGGNMNFTGPAIASVFLTFWLLAAPAIADTRLPQSAVPANSGVVLAAEKCMPCQRKCRVCFAAGKSTFPSVEACIRDCNQRGNPSVDATCGVRKGCAG